MVANLGNNTWRSVPLSEVGLLFSISFHWPASTANANGVTMLLPVALLPSCCSKSQVSTDYFGFLGNRFLCCFQAWSMTRKCLQISTG